MAPPFTGDLRLVDAETGEAREVTITSGLLARYQQRLQAHHELLEGLGNRYGVNYVSTNAAERFDQLVLRYLKVRRVLQ